MAVEERAGADEDVTKTQTVTKGVKAASSKVIPKRCMVRSTKCDRNRARIASFKILPTN